MFGSESNALVTAIIDDLDGGALASVCLLMGALMLWFSAGSFVSHRCLSVIPLYSGVVSLCCLA